MAWLVRFLLQEALEFLVRQAVTAIGRRVAVALSFQLSAVPA